MASPKDRPAVPTALMYRPVEGRDARAWDVETVDEHRMAGYLEAGWIVLISESQIKAGSLDQDPPPAPRRQPFNPPKPR